MLDEATKNRTFGHYARVLIDIDLSKRLFDEIMVEREGYAFHVEVVYEKLPEYCNHCHLIGHSVNSCNKLHPKAPIIGKGRPKKGLAVQQQYRPKPIEQVGTSHSTEKSDHVAEKSVPVMPKSTAVAGTQEPQIDDSDSDTEEVVIFERDDGQGRKNTHEAEFVKSPSGQNNNNNDDEGFVQNDISQAAQHASSSNNVPETPLLDQGNGIRVTQDQDLPLVAQQDVSLIRQGWADMVEQEQFTTYLSKGQKKKLRRKARSAEKSYNTRSREIDTDVVDCVHGIVLPKIPLDDRLVWTDAKDGFPNVTAGLSICFSNSEYKELD
ncbi:unnamed protein product [Trifolium pratense]|uniref:Uncharacterized protein n=1 Tax=Trifolium pratense TaxID=57577 RepID=A0ACB0LH09_TRIPR|nr:unnamed protein product [Trifolium pratense]